jgi:hypothetical protein
VTKKLKVELRSVTTLQLDARNPRLTGSAGRATQRQLIQYLFQHYDAIELARSIARNGFFIIEPLLAVHEGDRVVVVEGNRRLAALKALKDPSLLEQPAQRQVESLASRVVDPSDIATVPVIIAPSRKATDRILATRHAPPPRLQLRWEKENRSRFILQKLDEGYKEQDLLSELGFTQGEVTEARFFNRMVELTRNLELDEPRKSMVETPGKFSWTTLERILESTAARKYLHIYRSETDGFEVKAERQEFVQAFKKVVEDIADGNIDSRTVNDAASIDEYFVGMDSKLLPKATASATSASDFLPDLPEQSDAAPPRKLAPKKAKKIGQTAIPKSFKPAHGSDKLLIIHRELTGLKRDGHRYAAAMLLRVFLELSVTEYLHRMKLWQPLLARLQQGGRKLPHGPPMQELVKEILKVAKGELDNSEFKKIEKALKYDESARFNISELHSFVHGADVPTGHDLEQFWVRTEPLFVLLLQ